MSMSSGSPTPHFAEAVRTFLNKTDASSMEEFHRRLQPFRIMWHEVTVGGENVSSPILMLESAGPDHRDTGTLDKEDCYLLAASLSSNYGFGPGISPQQMLAISEFAESYRLEDIGIGQLGTETYVPDELVIATSNTGYELLDLGLRDGGLTLGACGSPLPPDSPSPPHLLRPSAECTAPSTLRTDHIANHFLQEPHEHGLPIHPPPPQSSSEEKGHNGLRKTGSLNTEFTNYIRKDFVCFIQENLSYWKVNGLWDRSSLSNPNWGSSGYESLGNIYSCMCELDLRIGQDQIRKRAALVLLDCKYKEALAEWQSRKKPQSSKGSIGVGRGDASAMIDNILGRMHPEWNSYNARQRSKLRDKFHNEKRHGKRWAVLVTALGPSVLFLCSSALARTVKDTTITLNTLEKITTNRISTLPWAMDVFQLMNPIAQSLLYNWDCRPIDTNLILGQLQVWQQTKSIVG